VLSRGHRTQRQPPIRQAESVVAPATANRFIEAFRRNSTFLSPPGDLEQHLENRIGNFRRWRLEGGEIFQ